MTVLHLLAVAVLLVAPVSSVQNHVTERYVGLSGGATVSDIAAGGISGSSRWGVTAGLVAGALTFDYTFVEVAPSWMQSGGEGLRLDCVDIPVMIGAAVPLGGRDLLMRQYGGVGIGIKLGCAADGTVTFGCDIARSTAWSLPIGVSVAKELSSGKFLGVDARYGAPCRTRSKPARASARGSSG